MNYILFSVVMLSIAITFLICALMRGNRIRNTFKMLVLALGLAVGASVQAQATNDTSIGGTLSTWLAEGITNSYWVPYGIYAPGLEHRYGFGIAAEYPISQYVLAGPRIDYVDGNFWMPSGNATLQVPVKVSSWFTLTPFTYAGVGIPVSGAQIGNFTVPGNVTKDNNGKATAILGAGVAIHLYTGSGWLKDAAIVGDIENWSGFPKQEYRLGVALHF